jgi:sporulation protein YlmC with PRC-barrel domain
LATACFCVGLAVPLLAAEPSVTGAVSQPSPIEKGVFAITAAEKCLSDLHAFDGQMEKDGYWLGGSGYTYGYPMDGAGFGNPMGGYAGTAANGYRSARPGYEIRMLVVAANILARQGLQQPCEDVLTTTRGIYKLYLADMRSGKMPAVDMPGWQSRLIGAAVPVTSKNSSFRSDELLGTEVRNPQNEPLGSVDDLVMSPQTGKIAFLVIGRGGIFGINKQYVPVPWENFKITPNLSLLVLDTTKGALDAAPQVGEDQFATAGQFDQQSQMVDAYWKAHLSSKGNN